MMHGIASFRPASPWDPAAAESSRRQKNPIPADHWANKLPEKSRLDDPIQDMQQVDPPEAISDKVSVVTEKVRAALEAPGRKWSTVKDLVRDTKLPEKDIHLAFSQLTNELLESGRTTVSGDRLFTTRRKYRGTATFWEKVLSGLTQRPM